MLRWRHWGVTLAVVYLTLVGGTLTTDFNAWTRIAHHALLTVLLGGWLFSLLRRGQGFPAMPLDGPLAAQFLVYGLATASAVDVRHSAEGLWLVGVHVLLFFVAVDLMRTYGPRAVIEPVLFTASVVVLVGLIEFAGWYFGLPILPHFRQGWFPIGGLRNPLPPIVYRLSFTLNVSTWLAVYLATLIPVGLAWAVSTSTRQTRHALALWLAGALVVLGMAFSRGGLLSLGVSSVVFGILIIVGRAGWWMRLLDWLRGWRGWVAVGVAVVGIAGLAWGWTSQDMGGHRAGDRQRIDLWRSAWRIGLEDPVTGVGPRGFGRALRAVRDPSVTEDHMTTPHNAALLAWSEAGLPGVVALGWLVSAAGWLGWRRWREADGPEKMRVAGAVAGLAGFATYNLVDNFVATPVLLPVIMLAAYLARPPGNRERATGPPRRLIPAGALALVVIAAVAWGAADTAQVHFSRAIRLARTGDHPAALDAIETARRIDPAMGMYAAQKAQILGEMAARDGAYLPAALDAYETAFGFESTSDILRASYAALLAQAGDTPGALEEMQAAARIRPSESVYTLWVGRYREALGEGEAAQEAYREALRLRGEWAASPFWEESALRRAARNAHLASLGLAAERLREVDALPAVCWGVPADPQPDTEATPPSALACLSRARLALEGDAAGALALAEQTVLADGGLADGYLARAEARLALGDEAAAERDARIALFLGSREAYGLLGRLAETRGDWQAAEEAYQQGGPLIVQLQGYDVAVYGRRGDLRLLPRLDAPGPSRYSLASWLALARLLEAQGRADDAASVYRAIRTVDPYYDAALPPGESRDPWPKS